LSQIIENIPYFISVYKIVETHNVENGTLTDYRDWDYIPSIS